MPKDAVAVAPKGDVVVFHMGYVVCQEGEVGGGKAEVGEIDVMDVAEIVGIILGGIVDAPSIELDVIIADTGELVKIEPDSSVDVLGNEVGVSG